MVPTFKFAKTMIYLKDNDLSGFYCQEVHFGYKSVNKNNAYFIDPNYIMLKDWRNMKIINFKQENSHIECFDKTQSSMFKKHNKCWILSLKWLSEIRLNSKSIEWLFECITH